MMTPIEIITQLRSEIDDLRIEIDELQKDKARLDWLADPDNECGSVLLPRYIVENNLCMRDGIDQAMHTDWSI